MFEADPVPVAEVLFAVLVPLAFAPVEPFPDESAAPTPKADEVSVFMLDVPFACEELFSVPFALADPVPVAVVSVKEEEPLESAVLVPVPLAEDLPPPLADPLSPVIEDELSVCAELESDPVPEADDVLLADVSLRAADPDALAEVDPVPLAVAEPLPDAVPVVWAYSTEGAVRKVLASRPAASPSFTPSLCNLTIFASLLARRGNFSHMH